MLNKKGHIPTILLFLGALILVIAVLFIFVSFKDDVSASSSEFAEIYEELYFREQFTKARMEWMVEKAVDMSGDGDFIEGFNSALKSTANFERERGSAEYVGNLYGKIANGDYEISLEEFEYRIVVKDVFVKADAGNSEIKRTFDLEVYFSQHL